MGGPSLFWLAGSPTVGAETFPVTSPYDGRHVSDVSVPTPDQVEAAPVPQAHDAAPAARSTPAHRRAEALHYVADQLQRRLEEVAQTIGAETGKPIGTGPASKSAAPSRSSGWQPRSAPGSAES